MSSVAAAQKNPELALYHAIAIKVLSEEPRLKIFSQDLHENQSELHKRKMHPFLCAQLLLIK
jgi:hypothetical protein